MMIFYLIASVVLILISPKLFQKRIKKIRIPYWVNTPQDSKYLAQDSNGYWHWFNEEPKLVGRKWRPKNDVKIYAGYTSPIKNEFKTSLTFKCQDS